MSVDSIITRILKWGIAKGSVWGTMPTLGAGDEMHPQSASGFNHSIPNSPDKGAGYGLLTNSVLGSEDLPVPSFSLYPYEDDDKFLLLLGAIFGSDVVSGVSDPYSHTMEMQNESTVFFGIGYQEGDEVKRIPSVKFDNLSIEPNNDGIIEFSATGKGDTNEVGVATDLDSVTALAVIKPYLFKNLTMRINAQSDGALASPTDDLAITHFKIDMPRPSESSIESGSGNWNEPVQGEFPEWRLTFKIDKKNALAKTLHTAFLAGTLQKADLVFTGTTTNRTMTFEFPAMKIEKSNFERSTKVGVEFTCLLQRATSAPTGMTGIENTFIGKSSVSSAVI